MSYAFEYVAIRHATGEVSRMQFITRADASCFDQRGAQDAGFTFDSATQQWVREATQETVQREIGRASFTRDAGAVAEWKVINVADMTNVRSSYNTIPPRKQLPTR